MGIISPIGTLVGGVVGCEIGLAAGRAIERESVVRQVSAAGHLNPAGEDCMFVGAASGSMLGGTFGLVCGASADVARRNRDKHGH